MEEIVSESNKIVEILTKKTNWAPDWIEKTVYGVISMLFILIIKWATETSLKQ